MAADQVEIDDIKAGADMPPFSRIKLDSGGLLQLADASDKAVGYVNLHGAVNGERTGIRLMNSPIFCCLAAVAIAPGDIVYGAASGKINKTAGGVVIGVAIDTAAGDGSVIRVIPTDGT